MTRRPIIGRKARARWAGKCPQCGAKFDAGAILYRVAAARNAWCAVPCRGRAQDPPAPPASRAGDGRNMPGLDGTVRWADPLSLVPEVSEHQRAKDTVTQSQEAWGDAVERITNGDTRPELMQALDAGREHGRKLAQPKAERLRWELDAVGALPSVPHYLSGCERTMLRPAMQASESAPLRIWVAVSAQFSLSEDELIRRGGVLAGIVETLAAVRPVELVAFLHGCEDIRIAWHVDPRDGSRIAPTFGQTALRGILIRWIRSHTERSAWYTMDVGRIRAEMGIPDGDLLVRPFYRPGEGDEADLAEYLAS